MGFISRNNSINHLAQSPEVKLSLWKKIIRKFIPRQSTIEAHPLLQRFSPYLNSSDNYWHFNSQSVSRGVAIALFCAFMLMPFQTILAICLALCLRANLPLSVGIIWINNPLTIAPIYYACYKVGAIALDLPIATTLNFDNIVQELLPLWEPFLLGTFICGLLAGCAGYALARLIWWLFSARTKGTLTT